jgi:excisionase family DNA binding protein
MEPPPDAPELDDRWHSMAAVMGILGVSLSTVRRLIASGELRAIHVVTNVRVSGASVRDYIGRNAVLPSGR